MTLEYASPEQIKGEPVTATSDIYSLGVLLLNYCPDIVLIAFAIVRRTKSRVQFAKTNQKAPVKV